MERELADKPQLLIVGGPNGSGKTTVAMQYASAEAIGYIGADVIAALIAPENPTSARVQAARQFIRSVDDAIVNKRSCVVESTLSGRSFRNCMLEARQNGYEITIVFVFVDSVDVCVARVAERVGKTFPKQTYDVATFVASRTFGRSIAIWPMVGSCCIMAEAGYKMYRLDRNMNGLFEMRLSTKPF